MNSPNSTDRIFLSLLFALLILSGFGGIAAAESSSGNLALAIKGYDSVSYFQAGKAVKFNSGI